MLLRLQTSQWELNQATQPPLPAFNLKTFTDSMRKTLNGLQQDRRDY
jgi:hypothetical protein